MKIGYNGKYPIFKLKMSHIKLMDEHEYLITRKMSDLGIAPKILGIKKLGNKYKVSMVKYPTTLLNYWDDTGDISKYHQLVRERINQIHNSQIIHGDLHADNIVLDPETDDLRIIDYGRSINFDEIDEDVIDNLNKFLEPDEDFRDLDDILKFELTMYLRNL